VSPISDSTDFIKLIKETAVSAVNAGKPCGIAFGTVTDVIAQDGEVINVKVRLDVKLIIDIDFLLFGKRLTKYEVDVGDKLILLRQTGGQLFYVMDKVGDDNATE
jgi:hypothetical protein